METEARGQLGGLETTDDVRQRLAKDSGAWTCSVCAKCNTEIMKDCEELCQDSDGGTSDVAIPQELKMVWKDEMKPGEKKADEKSTENNSEDAELAEGFVRTAPTAAPVAEPSATTVSPPQQILNRDPARNAVVAQHNTVQAMATRHQTTDDGIPLWIDRAIVVLVVLRIALLIKVFFGF